jgi:glucose-6-phosphate isomerase
MNRIEQMLNQASIEHCIPLFHRPHHCNITLPFHFSLTMAGTGATASQAWAILKRHARDEIEPLRLQELCRDNDRVSSLVCVHSPTPNRMLVVDLSRQRMTLETLNHLLRLASARGVRKYIARLAWGENDPDNPTLPNRTRQRDRTKAVRHPKPSSGEEEIAISSFYLSLRVPEGSKMLNADGSNALRKIHHEWDRIKQISDSIRRGQLPGVTGSMIRDVLVVGRGVPVMALRFIYLALCKDETATIGRKAGLNDINNRLRGGGGIRRIKFLTSADPVRAAGVVGDLDPATTLVISIALRGNEETLIATNTLKIWLLQSLGNGRRTEAVFGKHMMLVTGNKKITSGLKRESVLIVPESARSEPFSTFTAATLLVSF